MADDFKIGAGLALDGEKEFREAVKNINKDLSVLGSEMGKVTAEFSDNSNGMGALTSKSEVLNKQLVEQKNKVETLKTALENAKNEFGENSNKVKDWQIQLNNAEKNLAQTETAIKDNTQAIKDYNKNQLAAIKNSEEFKTAQENLGKVFNVVKVAAAAVTAAVVGFAVKAVDTADEIQRLADVTGMSAEQLQEWQYVGNNLGVELTTITGAQAKLTKSMYAATTGSKNQAAAFAALGISVTDSNGNLRDVKTVMLEAFDALNGVGNETERDAIAMQLFGKSAMELNPLIKAGADEVNKLGQAARNSGMVMSDEAVAGLDAFGDSIDNMKSSLVGKFGEAFASLSPFLLELTDKIQNIDISPLVNGLKWVIDNGKLIAGVGLTIAGVVAAVKIWETATAAVTIAQKLLNLAIAASPTGLIIAGITGLVAAITVLWKTNEDFRNAVINIGNQIKTFFTGLVEWAREIPAEFMKIGANIVEKIWEGIKGAAGWLKDQITGFVDGIVGVFTGKDGIDAHSPSRLFEKFGGYMAEGLGVGFTDKMDKVAQQINASVPKNIEMNGTYSANAQMGEGIVNGLAAVMGTQQIIIQPAPVVIDGKVVAHVMFDPLRNVAKQKGVALA